MIIKKITLISLLLMSCLNTCFGVSEADLTIAWHGINNPLEKDRVTFLKNEASERKRNNLEKEIENTTSLLDSIKSYLIKKCREEYPLTWWFRLREVYKGSAMLSKQEQHLNYLKEEMKALLTGEQYGGFENINLFSTDSIYNKQCGDWVVVNYSSK